MAANPMTLQPAAAEMSEQLRPASRFAGSRGCRRSFSGWRAGRGMEWPASGSSIRPALLAAAKPKRGRRFDLRRRVADETDRDDHGRHDARRSRRASILDAPVEDYIPDFAAAAKSDPDPAWRARVTARMLLLHDSGLPAHRDFYKEAKGRDAILARVLAEPLRSRAGNANRIFRSRLHSSRRNHRTARPANRSTHSRCEKFFDALGMDRSMFNPPRTPAPRHRAHRNGHRVSQAPDLGRSA